MNRFLTLLLLTFAFATAWADSPLTSTDFADAYADEPMVQLAAQSADDLPVELLNFLADPESPVDVRLAVINKIGWNFDGKSTGNDILQFLMQRYNVTDESQLGDRLNSGTLAVYAYAKAMSNYFNVTKASEIAHIAIENDESNSFSVAFIASLIDAQIYLDSDWSMVYRVVANVLEQENLVLDMRPEAVEAVMEYINLYKDY